MSIFSYVGVARCFKKHKPRVDSWVFRMSYRTTFVIFFISSLLVTAKEFFGAPIQCISTSKSIKALLNTYCYIMSTFSVPIKPSNATMGRDVAYPGTGLPDEDDGYVKVHSYYLWVPMVLSLQAMSFYLCHFIWKKCDGGAFEAIASDLGQFSLNRKQREEKKKIALEYVIEYEGTHQMWAYQQSFE